MKLSNPGRVPARLAHHQSVRYHSGNSTTLMPANPILTASAPILLVRDVVAAANHYRDTMGFGYDRFYNDPPDFVILHRDGMYLMLKQAVDPKHVVPHWTVEHHLWTAYFWVSDADALHAEFLANGAKIDYGPCDQPYGCREFGIQDLDGHDIGFGQVVNRPDA